MGYADQKFYTRELSRFAYITGTATASGANAVTGANLLTDAQEPTFNRRTRINNIRIVSNVATPSNWTAATLIIKNGTNTVGSDVITAATAGQVDSVTPNVGAGTDTFTANSGPTFVWSGTSTASGQSLGTQVVWFETQELFS